MQRVFAIFLAPFYLLTTSGLSVAIHYCQGKVESVALMSTPPSCCCEDFGMTGCCDDEVIVVKVSSEHNVAKNLTCPSTDQSPAIAHLAHHDAGTLVRRTSPFYIEPPPKQAPAFLLYCSFRC